jgi:Flp pilus assembly protein TadD
MRTTLQQAGRIDEAMAVPVPEGRHPAFGRDPWNRQLNDYRERPPMEEALDLLQRGQPDAALAVLEPFVREQPDDLNARAYLAQALAAVGRAADARAALDGALAREPDSLVLLRVLAGLQEQEDDLEGALATLGRIVAVAPNDVEGWLRKGTLETTAGRLEDALASLRRVHALDRRAPALLVRIGGLELAGGDAEAAVVSFEAARAAGVRENALTLGLARAYAQLGRVADARALLDGASELGRAGEVLLEELAAGAPR